MGGEERDGGGEGLGEEGEGWRGGEGWERGGEGMRDEGEGRGGMVETQLRRDGKRGSFTFELGVIRRYVFIQYCLGLY